MNFKNQMPFLMVPLALVMLVMIFMDAVRGQFDPSTDIPRYAFCGLWGCYWLVSGLIHWNKPYITTDDKNLTVFDHQFTRQTTKVIPWDLMRGHAGRSFRNIRLEMADGETVKIPINGMSGKNVAELLALIDEKTKMRTMGSGIASR